MTVMVGGPPAGAVHVRTRRVIPPAPLPPVTRHNGARTWWRNRATARDVHAYQDPTTGRWHVVIADGLGRTVAPVLPPLPDVHAARRVAATVVRLLSQEGGTP